MFFIFGGHPPAGRVFDDDISLRLAGKTPKEMDRLFCIDKSIWACLS
jgi:hypothetical protein